MLRTCSCMIALSAMLTCGLAQGADTILTLACQGTETYREGSVPLLSKERISPISIGIIVNLTAQTVEGRVGTWGTVTDLDSEPLTIDTVTEAAIRFHRFVHYDTGRTSPPRVAL